jgi:hypothetical protein
VTVTLSDDAWEQVQNIVKERLGRPPPPDFRAALDGALQVYQASAYLQERGSPKQVRYNLQRAIKAALNLNARLNDLDGNSRQLLGEVPGGDISQLYASLEKVVLALDAAERKAGEWSKTRAGVRDNGPANMAYYLAKGLRQYLQHEAVSTEQGLFAQLYAVLADLVNASSDGKAIRAALRAVRERERQEAGS